MDSRVFIAEAAVLIKDIEEFAAANLPAEEEQFQGRELQKRITRAFNSLQNPTLPSAYKLRDAAQAVGFATASPTQLRTLAMFENLRA